MSIHSFFAKIMCPSTYHLRYFSEIRRSGSQVNRRVISDADPGHVWPVGILFLHTERTTIRIVSVLVRSVTPAMGTGRTLRADISGQRDKKTRGGEREGERCHLVRTTPGWPAKDSNIHRSGKKTATSDDMCIVITGYLSASRQQRESTARKKLRQNEDVQEFRHKKCP